MRRTSGSVYLSLSREKRCRRHYLVRAQAGFKLRQTQRLSEVDGSSAPCLLPERRSAVIWCVRVVAVKIYDVTCITSAVVPARQPSTTSMFSAPEQRYQRNLAERMSLFFVLTLILSIQSPSSMWNFLVVIHDPLAVSGI